jgi:FkbH-like protein
VTDEEIAALIADNRALTLQIRLTDTFGDNGIIAIVIGLFDPGTHDIRLDTWLMSCRVLGRQMEEETLNLVVEQARALGAARLIGVYRPTAKNGMVKEHYQRLGFAPHGDADFVLPLDGWTRLPTEIASEAAP